MSLGSTYLGQYNVNVAIRPERLGYLVRHGSAEEFKKAVGEATTRWGGITEPIITYSVDGALSSATALAIAHPVDNFTIVGESTVDQAANLRGQINADLIPFEQVDHLGLHQLAVQPRPDPDDRHLVLVTPSDPWPPPIHAARAGDSAATVSAAGLADEAAWEIWKQFGSPLNPMEWPGNYQAQLGRRTAIHASAAQLRDLPGSQVGVLPSVIVVVTEGDLDDAIYFWNLRSGVRLGVFEPIDCLLIDKETFARREVLGGISAQVAGRFEHVTPAVLVIARLAGAWSADDDSGLGAAQQGPYLYPPSPCLTGRLLNPRIPSCGRHTGLPES